MNRWTEDRTVVSGEYDNDGQRGGVCCQYRLVTKMSTNVCGVDTEKTV